MNALSTLHAPSWASHIPAVLRGPLLKAMQRAPLIACAVLAALAVAEVAHQGRDAWRLRHPRGAEATRAAQTAASLPQRPALDIMRLANAHLFGAAPAMAQPQGDPDNAPDADPQFQLAGVVAMPDPKAGFAIISRQGQPEKLYMAGGALEGSGHLFEVYADRVILEVGGQYQTLRLLRYQGGAGLLAALMKPPEEVAETPAASFAPGEHPLDVPFTPVTATQSLFGSLSPADSYAHGKYAGLSIDPNPRQREKFGLQRDDVVVAINGQRLVNSDSFKAAMQKASNDNSNSEAAALQLTVSRNGALMTIDISEDH